ncbi:MAG: hypothetical protein ACR2MP_04835 [Streptosporangiaceae bacterium]
MREHDHGIAYFRGERVINTLFGSALHHFFASGIAEQDADPGAFLRLIAEDTVDAGVLGDK